MSAVRVVIVGAGINGLCAGYQLHRLGCRDITIVEQFALDHVRGSSHGHSRITRSSYAHADYVRLMEIVHQEEWPRLSRDLARPLILPAHGCFFGTTSNMLDQYAEAVATVGAKVERITTDRARQIFPQFTFVDSPFVLHDHTAGVLLADKIKQGLIDYLRRAGVTILEHTKVASLNQQPASITITLEHLDPTTGHSSNDQHAEATTLDADAVVLSTGGWVRGMVPELANHLQVARQTVAYVRLTGEQSQFGVERFPVWVYLTDDPSGMHYGLPQLADEGIKYARHLTSLKSDDVEMMPTEPNPDEIARLLEFARVQFTAADARVVSTDFCLYTNAPNEDFLIDRLHDEPRVHVMSACSGHGFKFAPLSGRMIAERIIHGEVQDARLKAAEARFRWPIT